MFTFYKHEYNVSIDFDSVYTLFYIAYLIEYELIQIGLHYKTQIHNTTNGSVARRLGDLALGDPRGGVWGFLLTFRTQCQLDGEKLRPNVLRREVTIVSDNL